MDSSLTKNAARQPAFRPLSPIRPTLKDMSTKKKDWNSSVKIDIKSHRAIIMNRETPKFPKPDFRAKKPLDIQSKINGRVSGVCKPPETPVITDKVEKNRFTMPNNFNKENNTYLFNINKKNIASIEPNSNINPLIHICKTPISNMSFKHSNSDASFLRKEKEIDDEEEKIKALREKLFLENICRNFPPVSTPFKEYRNVTDFFNNNNNNINSVLCKDTTTSFDQATEYKDRRDKSVIVLLGEVLNKATVDSNNSTELIYLLDIEKQSENNINMIQNVITTLQNIKAAQEKSLQCVKKLINEKRAKKNSETENNNIVVAFKENEVKMKQINSPKSPTLRTSVVNIKSPSSKIPIKNLCLNKKDFHKTMPDMSKDQETPPKNDVAFNMYMELKENMTFLKTPLVERCNDNQTEDTPTVTSHNLQMQLDKLYSES